MKTSSVPLLVAVAATAVVLPACSGAADANSAKPSASCPAGLTIGFLGGLTGPNRNLTVNAHQGAQLAVAEHNARPGACQVALTDYDTLGDTARAAAAAHQAVADSHLVGLVGPGFSSEAVATGPTFDEAGLVTVSPTATNGALTSNGWRTFHRVVNSDWTQGPTAAAFTTKTLGRQRIYVIDDGSDYGKGMTDVFRKSLGSSFVGHVEVQQDQRDFSRVVDLVKSTGADAVFYGGYYADAGRLVKALRDAGLDQERLAFVTDDAAKDDAFVAAGGPQTEGAYVTCPCSPPEKADPAFLESYSQKFGTNPGTFAAEGYDAANVLLRGIEAKNTTRADLLAFVPRYQGHGVSKDIAFTPQGDITEENVWTYRVQGGQLLPNKVITAADG